MNLAARLGFNNADFMSGARESKKEAKSLDKSLDGVGKSGRSAGKGMTEGSRGADKMSRESKKLAKESETTSQSLLKVKNVIAGIAFGLAAQDFTKTIFEYEKFKGVLTSTFQGSEELAGQAFKAIENFASETPYTLNQSLDAFVKLRNLGIVPTRDLMESMGNTSAAMGRGCVKT